MFSSAYLLVRKIKVKLVFPIIYNLRMLERVQISWLKYNA